MMKSIALFLLVCILSILLVSCRGEKREQTIQLPSTSVLTIRSNWGVVKSNYLRMRTEPSKSAAVLDGLTKGTVVEVLSSTEKEETIENETSYWFRIDMEGLKGWIFGAYLEILDSKSKAEAYARELK